MRATFRAVVMLTALVGLPAAWIHYGPLPNGAQRVVDRVVSYTRGSLGLAPLENRDADSSARVQAALSFGHEGPGAWGVAARPQTNRGAAGRPASSAPIADSAATPIVPTEDDSLGSRLEPLLAQLRELGAADYELEHWGSSGALYRFHCSMPLSRSVELTRQFESVSSDPRSSVEQVVAQVASWQATRP